MPKSSATLRTGTVPTTNGHGDHDAGSTIYHPLEIAEPYEFHFENDCDLFGRHFPIGCHQREQTIWLVDVGTGRVASIYHETHPDDYADEEWLDAQEWKRQVKLS
jgi:hypothetical protein